MKMNQTGSALISVLVILLLITVIGILAIRQGLTNLNIATNSQVKSLLLQSSDYALQKIEVTANGNANSPVWTFLRQATNTGAEQTEFWSCYRPMSDTDYLRVQKASEVVASATTTDSSATVSTNTGLCDLTADFISPRKTAVTQLSVMQNRKSKEDIPFQYAEKGSDTKQYAEQPKLVTVYSTSILPGMASSDISTIQSACMQNRIADNLVRENSLKEGLGDCLARMGAPATTQVQDFILTALKVSTPNTGGTQ